MAEGAAARALRESLNALGTARDDLDKAAVQLARRYAGLLDAATPASRYRPALDKISRAVRSADADTLEALAKVRDALGAHSVASDLGPKYLAVLTALGLTPASRGAKATGTPSAPAGKRNELKERREQRERERAAAGTG